MQYPSSGGDGGAGQVVDEQDGCITQPRRELGYMSLEMKLGKNSTFFDTHATIKARIERQSKIHRKERLAHID